MMITRLPNPKRQPCQRDQLRSPVKVDDTYVENGNNGAGGDVVHLA